MYKKGTIVLVPFPFTDLSGNKVRPALIISKVPTKNDVVMVFITSKTKAKAKNLVSVQPDSQTGLKIKSHIVCGKIATLDKKIILGELGSLTKAAEKKVDNELKKVLGL